MHVRMSGSVPVPVPVPGLVQASVRMPQRAAGRMAMPARAGPTQPRRIGRCDERGVATVFAIGLMGVLLAVTVVAAGGTRVAVASHRAAATADLAALAGATAVRHGVDGCAAAEATARSNGGRVTACAADGLDVRVTVVVDTPRMVGLSWSLAADARAGPATAG